jgi:methenyltetrahydromethanopterin cyclohydrolase
MEKGCVTAPAVAIEGVPVSGDPKPSVNALAAPLTAALIADAQWLRLGVERVGGGAVVVDAGIAQRGGLEAGRRIAEICMGGMGRVALHGFPGRWPTHVSVLAADPVLSCLGSQYAGWSLAHGEGKGAFRALGSGPGRALAVKEDLFTELGYRDHGDSTCLVLEVDRPPPPEIVDKVARDCGVAASRITFILTPTQSLAGMVQVVSRVLEVALHKVHALGFALDRVVDGTGHAPLPPAGGDFITAMGRTNDAILFGGEVHLHVDAPDADAEELARRLPASASRDYGRPFAQVFKDYKYDFYQIDPMLFAPARVMVTALKSGRSFAGGAVDLGLLDVSFGGKS